MKPAWDQLGGEYAASPDVLIGDADCTAAAEELCTKFEVKGYPTIKYFKDGDTNGVDYQGGRDYDSMKKFVEENLEVPCKTQDTAKCSEKERKYIDKMEVKSSEDRKKQINRLEGMKGGSMKAELKQWISQRLNILKQLESPSEEL
jgi:protein disulfide-isomerase A6